MQIAQPGRGGGSDIQRYVIGKIVKQSKRVQVIVCGLFERRCPGFPDVDAYWNRRPTPTFAQPAQSFGDRVRPVVIKTEAIDQRLLVGQSKDAWLRISR